jgi:hypothetical protein
MPKKKTIRVSADVSPAVLRALKILAATRGVTLGQLQVEILTRAVGL